MKKLSLILILFLILPLAYSMQGKMPLLAIKQTDDGYAGSLAELFLEIEPGTGRVFVDTFPLSKIDTQISMRFAKEMACDFLEKDCDDYNFIYTIKASSPIIGGPSAGAAATILTISVLSDTKLKKNIAITGTINSGGLVGPVGGIKEKIDAASKTEIKTILIPEGEGKKINSTDNISLAIKQYEEDFGMRIIEVADINSALLYFTGKEFKSFEENISISQSYTDTMKGLADNLCDRNLKLRNTMDMDNFSDEINKIYDSAINFSRKGEKALKEKEFYSAASHCFGSNIRLSQVFLETKNFSEIKYKSLLEELRKKILGFDKKMDKKEIKTITDLESYMVVKERLIEALKYANLTKNDSYSYNYAYANERLYSAYSWSEFFKHTGRILQLDESSLKDSCRQRISESEERLQYASIYLSFDLKSPREELDKAYNDFNQGNYALCLFKASKSKAESNIVLNTMGVDSEYIPKLIDNKLKAATRVIVKAEKKDTFPILGYSYYEYAANLKDTDKFSALLYAEYALELSNLDIYFKEKKNTKLQIPPLDILQITIGILLGLLIGLFINLLNKKQPKKKKKKNR
ncbi:MAG: hypothetical protein KAK00_10205 [Nanoarchaeota archaeon]|nr:hypothetical protein [Nanoarchaeota archaeon]